MQIRFSRQVPLAALVVSAIASSGPDALACGGLFCSTSNPVNQVAERIVFAQNDDDTITAAIEIQYQGPSHEFAWVLPVPAGDISVGVSSKQALDALQAASNPVYQLNSTFDSCGTKGGVNYAAAGATPPNQGSADEAGGGVTVVASGAVGPYDWTVIEVDPSLDDRADAAVEWLGNNGFDIAGIGPDVLRIYLDQDMNLLAFKLSKDSDSGSIRPVLISYPGKRPVIPIQPTAVAANDDMGILVWVLGSGRAVPTNYLDLELDEARINWLNPGPTYNDVVIAAADEAGGWGFVTEQSGKAQKFVQTVLPSGKTDQFDQLRTGQFSSIEDFLQQAVGFGEAPYAPSGGFAQGGFVGDQSFQQEMYDGFMDVLSDPDIVPLREGASAEQLLACVYCYFDQAPQVQNDSYPSTPYVSGSDPIEGMDVQAFLDALEKQVLTPLRKTQKLFRDNQQVTRLYTTLSPDEMTIDPEFDTNDSLPDVDNVHTADRVTHCDGTSWTMTLPQGHTITGSGGTWPVSASDDALPYNLRAVQLSAKGDGEVVIDNYAKVSQALVDLGVSPKPKESSGFCAFTELPHRPGRYSFGAAGLLFGVLLLRRRRQR